MLPVLIIFLVILFSAILCHYIAKSRGANPVFWGFVGAVFGPLAIPFAFFARSKVEPDTDAEISVISNEEKS